MDEQKKLYRLPKQGIVAGVAAGFADYFNMDVSVMRIIFVIFAIATSGLGVLLYIILAIILPVVEAPETKDEERDATGASSSRLREYFGGALILVGLWLLIDQLFPRLLTFPAEFIWPALLIGIGAVLVARSR